MQKATAGTADDARAETGRRRVFGDRRLWLMFAFGFVSGLPLYLSGFTLRQWLAEGQVSLAAIGLTANVSLSYTLKFLWAPFLDHVRPPGPFARFGRRRGWMLTVQPLLTLACLGMALSDAAVSPALTIAAAAVIAFMSATQDIAIDAWRIETFPANLQGAANAVYVWGYRVAMLVSGAGVIWAAGHIGWHGALLVVTVLAALSMVVTLAAPEPAVPPQFVPRAGGLRHIGAAIADTFGEFLSRPGALIILAFVALFNLGEAMAGVMLAPFYRSLGFDRGAVAAATGPYALVATMAGIGLGGWLVARLGVARALITTGFIQMAAMAMYVLLSLSAGDHSVLFATVMTEAFAQGLATAAFIAYLSTLCSVEHTATQFALLTSIAPLAANTVGGLSGFLVEATGWTLFYVLAMAASLPAVLLMLFILRRYPPQPRAA
jgi:PAT family beta-lactamase induction signal transducer AmpG